MLTDSGIISPFVPDSGNIFRKISSKDPIITLTLNVSVKCLIGNIEQDFLTSSSEWLVIWIFASPCIHAVCVDIPLTFVEPFFCYKLPINFLVIQDMEQPGCR